MDLSSVVYLREDCVEVDQILARICEQGKVELVWSIHGGWQSVTPSQQLLSRVILVWSKIT